MKENDNDRFLQENMESEVDCLSVGTENETVHFPTDDVIDLSVSDVKITIYQ